MRTTIETATNQNRNSTRNRRVFSAALFALAATALAATPRQASADSDSYTDEATRALGWVNTDCGTNITLVPLNVADFKARSGGVVNACEPIFAELRKKCHQDSGKPHPAGQAFIKENIKSISCKYGPTSDKQVTKVSIAQNGALSYEITPKFSDGGETKEALAKDPTFSKIFEKRRVWDLVNVSIPDELDRLKADCGDDLKMTIDIPSWQARGYLKSYPDADAAGVCYSYAAGILKACRENKAKARARVSSIRCGLLPKDKEQERAQVRMSGKEVVVTIGDLAWNPSANGDLVYNAMMKSPATSSKTSRR